MIVVFFALTAQFHVRQFKKMATVKIQTVFNLLGSFYKALLLISSTTPGSNNVLVSPRVQLYPSATFHKIRLMIFRELVLGKPVTICILSGLAKGPISLVICSSNSFLNSATFTSLAQMA